MAGQVLALIRELYVAARVGASASLDALLVALVLPILVSGIIAGSLRTAIVPAYFDLVARDGHVAARRFLGAVLTWSTLIAVLATLVLAATPGIGLALTGPGLDGPARAEAMAFLPLVLPILAFAVLTHLLSAVCQIGDRYEPIAIALIAAPAASLGITILAWDQLGLFGVAVGLTVGHVATVLSLLAFAGWTRLLPPLTLRAHRRDFADFLGHAVPLTVGSAVLQFNLVADRAIASLLPAGAVSTLKFGQQLVTEPLGAASSAWTTALYPSLVRSSQRGAAIGLGAASTLALRYGIVLFVPLAVGIAALAPLAVGIVYVRGAFDEKAAIGTAQVVVGFAPMLAIVMLRPVVTGAHNARRHGRLLGATAVANAISNLVLNVLLGGLFGVGGLALSTSITTGGTLLYLTMHLARSERDFDIRALGSVLGRSLLASMIPGAMAAWIAWGVGPTLPLPASGALLVLLAGVGLATYLALAARLRLEEPGQLVSQLRSRLARGSAS